MPSDPSRRPSNDRVRLEVDFDALVWVECSSCLGDGWHYPMARGIADRLLKNRKVTCQLCSGLGAVQARKIECGPNIRVVPAPKGAPVSGAR
ncbi:hypothetical protein [Novosphingobium sp. AP12]|uniref:hypothetical protein n=1 Tax=Novosphingobium sp. AP12 TaxID=1144305 RepID=UPI00027205DE|nr:hypothetical protein [Novosphingobium sp. AP12]EJL23962.1 hypothetical protein PMI02_03882 [Novosphingobium sp. AP12]